jgi:hypothetical protein
MKLEQEVYGLHNGEGCEDFDAGETSKKHEARKEKKHREEDTDKKEDEDDEPNEAYGLQG